MESLLENPVPSPAPVQGAWEPRQLLFIYGSLFLPTGDAGLDAAMAGADVSPGKGIHPCPAI